MPTALTPPAPANVVWRAGNDRVAHAHSGSSPRTLCGELVVQERLAWPAFRRCMVCTAAVDQGLAASIPEGEARALWGDR